MYTWLCIGDESEPVLCLLMQTVKEESVVQLWVRSVLCRPHRTTSPSTVKKQTTTAELHRAVESPNNSSDKNIFQILIKRGLLKLFECLFFFVLMVKCSTARFSFHMTEHGAQSEAHRCNACLSYSLVAVVWSRWPTLQRFKEQCNVRKPREQNVQFFVFF